MPLLKGDSPKIVSQNISEFHGGKTYNHTAAKFGKERADKQAVAVALATARRYGKRSGGGTPMAAGGFNSSRWIPRPPNLEGSHLSPVGGRAPGAIAPHAGMIHSTIPGRTDKLPMNVRGGSYVIPASVVSGMGQGNSLAGADALNKLFGQGPYGDKMRAFGTPKPNFGHPMRIAPPPMRMPKPAKAGGVEEGGDHVPIVAAGGEFIISPEVVRRIGNGDMKQGHAILDELVMHIRRQTIKDMKGERPPKK